jgi:hypothetical protein
MWKVSALLNVTQCRWVGSSRRSAGSWCLHLRELFGPEDEGSMFFQNVGNYRSATQRPILEDWDF